MFELFKVLRLSKRIRRVVVQVWRIKVTMIDWLL